MNYQSWRTDPPGHADADAIAILYGRARGSIYRLASQHRWRRIRHGRRTLYDMDDVDRTMVALDTPAGGT